MVVGNIKLKYRMMIILGAFTTAIFTAFVAMNLTEMRSNLLAESTDRALSRVESSANSINAFLVNKSKVAWTISQEPGLLAWLATDTVYQHDHSEDPVFRNLVGHFRSLIDRDPEIKSVFVGSHGSGHYYFEDERDYLEDDYDLRTRGWYQQLMDSREVLTNIELDMYGELIASYNIPIYDDAGRPLGVAGIDITPATLGEFINSLKSYHTSTAMLVDRNGVFLHHPDMDMALECRLHDLEVQDGDGGIDAAGESMAAGGSGFTEVTIAGQEQFLVHAPVEILDAFLILTVDRSEILARYDTVARTSAVMVAVSVLILLTALALYTHRTTRPIEMMADLCSSFIGESREHGRLRRTNDEIALLKTTFRALSDYVDEVTDSSNEIMASSCRIASEAKRQEDMVDEASRAMRDMTSWVDSSHDNARKAGEITSRTITSTAHGVQQMKQLTGAMETLSTSSREMMSFIETVETISLQTNMLALNAAIEAAHAGDAGSGFGVVANEIRDLAMRSSKAASQIAVVLNRAGEEVRDGVEISGEVLSQFNEFQEQVSEVGAVMRELESISDRHTGTIHNVDDIIHSVVQITKSNADNSAHTSRGATSMAERAVSIRRRLPRFEETEIAVGVESEG